QATGKQTLGNVRVRNSDAGDGATIHATNSCTDQGFNTNWDFGTAPALTDATAAASDLTRVYVRYGEAMDPATAADPANSSLSGGLSVTAAGISGDKKLVTLTASGPVTPGTTTVTVGNAIRSLVQHNLPTTTVTVVAGNSNGIPDTLGAVGL